MLIDLVPKRGGKQEGFYSVAMAEFADESATPDGLIRLSAKFSRFVASEGWITLSHQVETTGAFGERGGQGAEPIGSIGRVPVELVCRPGVEELSDVRGYIQSFGEKWASSRKVYSLAYDDGGLAVGVSPLGEDFVPLWSSESAVDLWKEDFPDQELELVDADVFTNGLSKSFLEEDFMVGIAISSFPIVIIHPFHITQYLATSTPQEP